MRDAPSKRARITRMKEETTNTQKNEKEEPRMTRRCADEKLAWMFLCALCVLCGLFRALFSALQCFRIFLPRRFFPRIPCVLWTVHGTRGTHGKVKSRPLPIGAIRVKSFFCPPIFPSHPRFFHSCNLCDSWLFFFGCGLAAPSSQHSLRFNSFVESMIGSTTHVFAGRRGQSFFCPQFFCLFLFG